MLTCSPEEDRSGEGALSFGERRILRLSGFSLLQHYSLSVRRLALVDQAGFELQEFWDERREKPCPAKEPFLSLLAPL